MRIRTIFIILFLPMAFVRAQQPNNRDSLLLQLVKAKEDTNKVWTLLHLAKYYETNNQDSSVYYLEKSKTLSESLRFTRGIFYYYQQNSIVSFTRGNYEKAMEENNTALRLARQLKDSSLVIMMLNHIGIVYGLEQKYNEQLDFALQVKNVVESMNDSTRLSGAYHNLANCYNNLKQHRKAVDYALLSIRIYVVYKKKNDYINRVYATLAQNYEGLQMTDSALYFYDKAVQESIRLNDKYAEASIYGFISGLYADRYQFNDMLKVSEKSLALARELQSSQMVASALYNLGYANFFNGHNSEAKKNITEALEISMKDSLREELINSYADLSYIAARDGDFKTLIWAKKKTDSIYEIVLKNEVVKNTTELEKKYETEKKDNLLRRQQVQIQRKNTLNYILIGGTVTFLLISLLAYRTYIQKQRIQQQRIRELEKDRQLVAVDSMLKGQEEERSRLAKDLHDGLGGLLSGVKFSLSNMKDNLIVTPENMALFERSLDMIDGSINELRRVAHNMMPEMLTKFGLDEALKEYCNTIQATKLLEVRYQSVGMDSPLDKSTQIIIYRIIQELLNNTMKHAAATEFFVQLIRENNRLNLVAEDNGKGFDTELLQKRRGDGWTNIRSRVDYLKGQLDVHSEPGKGTLVNIEFNI